MDIAFDRILIAVDDSKYAMKAASIGFSFATKSNAQVGLVYVINQAREITNPDTGMTAGEGHTVLLSQAERTIRQYIRLYDGDREVIRFTPSGIPEVEIVNIANEWRADLIVMGTHGRSAVGRILSGSIAEYVIRHATMPVLVAPPRMG